MTSIPSWHEKTIEELWQMFETSPQGLTESEVEKRLATYGHNTLPSKKQITWWQVLFSQFTSPMVIILVGAAFLSTLLAEWVDACVITAAILLNTTIGFVQEYKANHSLQQLRSFLQPQAIVRREGKEKEIAAATIVPGDVLVLHLGDQITADAHLVEAISLEVNEVPLTGESLPISKQTEPLLAGKALAERTNMVYAGTHVVGGHGLALVIGTGTQTEIGRIASLVAGAEEVSTPLQTQLRSLARWLAMSIIVIILILFGWGIVVGHGLFEMLELSIALAVAAIPEGLVLSVTVVLAVGMQRILKRGSLVRQMIATETLGSVSVLCTDKTGTITEGDMQVVSLLSSEGHWQTGEPFPDFLNLFLQGMVVCSQVSFREEKGQRVCQGNLTECALSRFVEGLRPGIFEGQSRPLAEIPFDSVHKYMATWQMFEEKETILVKGAPERILSLVTHEHTKQGKKFFDEEHRKALMSFVSEQTQKGLRVIALAYRPASFHGTMSEKDLSGMTLLGLICLRDPLRKEAKEEIRLITAAGVRTIIVTGDHPQTAQAIGQEAGIVTDIEQVATGEMLDGWNDQELKEQVEHITIYARVEPRHKIRIVQAWQARGEVVAMTGDGVNDAPALKAADIGIALGSGTEVAKQSSDLVLLDNNLKTITAAIEQGRIIFDNIRKIVIYLLTSSFTEMVLVGGALFLGLPTPLLAVHILWINIVQDSFPSLALTLDPGQDDVLKRAPRPRGEAVLNKESLLIIFLVGLVSDLILFFVFLWYLANTHDLSLARTVMFTAVGLNALIYVFAIRSLQKPLWRISPFSNPWLIASVLFGFVFLCAVLLLPITREAFGFTFLSLFDLSVLLMIVGIKVLAIELVKWGFRRKQNGLLIHNPVLNL